MPNRILREQILTSRAVNQLSESAELFYRRLMSAVDDFGRFEADPEILLAKLYPLQLARSSADKCAQLLAECGQTRTTDGEPLVLVYSVNKRRYLQISNFGQRERASKYPPPSLADKSGETPPSARATTPTPHTPPNTTTPPTPTRELSPEEWEEPTPDDYARRLIEGDPPARENGLAARHWSLVDPRLCMAAAREKFIGATNPEGLLAQLRANHAAYKHHHDTHPRERGKQLQYWLADGQCMVPPPNGTGKNQQEEW